jgi:hypothetical protein
MDINPDAPVLTRDEVLIDAPLSDVWQIQTRKSSVRHLCQEETSPP